MSKAKIFSICSFLFANFFVCSFAFGAKAVAPQPEFNPYIPHIYLSGYYGSADGEGAALGQADVLAPIFLRNDRNLFIYAQGRFANEDQGNEETWTGTAGLGYRQIFGARSDSTLLKSPRIFGAYILADYSGLPYETFGSDANYWVISPGIETLGETVDFRMNGYFPIEDQIWKYETYSNYVAKGNEIWADQYEGYEETGPGGDAELGVKLFSIDHMPVKAFINGYYFDTKDNGSVQGVGGRVTFQPTRYLTLELKDSYDNYQHNVFMAGLKIYVNGLAYSTSNTHVDEQGIQPRLYDPIERNLATIGVGNSTPVITSSTHEMIFKGNVVVQDHDVFVEEADVGSASAIQGSGTAEDPYLYSTGDMSVILDNAHSQFSDYSNVYFAPGNYHIGGSGEAQLYGNQSIYGSAGSTAQDWFNPAAPGAVTFYGTFTLGAIDSGSQYGLNYLSLLNEDDQPQGVLIENDSTANLKDVIVGTDTLDEANNGYNFNIGIVLNNSALNLDNTKVYGYSIPAPGAGFSTSAIGLAVTDGKDITAINNSLVKGYSTVSQSGYGLWGYGIYIYSDSSDIAKIGNISGDGTSTFSGTNSTDGYGYGIYMPGNDSSTVGEIGNIDRVNFFGGLGGFNVGYYFLGSLTVGDISNSNFTGIHYIAFNITNVCGTVDIGSIQNSVISSNGYGLFISADGPVTIGSITNSQFLSNDYYGFDIQTQTSGGDITIGNISGNTFQAGTPPAMPDTIEFGLNSPGTITVGSTQYTADDAQALYDAMTSNSNIFMAGPDYYVVINGNGYPP